LNFRKMLRNLFWYKQSDKTFSHKSLRMARLAPALLALIMVQSCVAPLIIVGAAAGIAVAKDRRTANTILEDQSIEIKIANAIRADEELAKQSHISVVSYNYTVLLIGQTPEKRWRDRAVSLARQAEKVKRVHNEISIAQPTSYKVRNNDAWLTTKIKTKLLGEENLASLHVKVVTEDAKAYLLGWISREEGNDIARVVQQVKGIKAVVKVFEYSD